MDPTVVGKRNVHHVVASALTVQRRQGSDCWTGSTRQAQASLSQHRLVHFHHPRIIEQYIASKRCGGPNFERIQQVNLAVRIDTGRVRSPEQRDDIDLLHAAVNAIPIGGNEPCGGSVRAR